MEEIKLADLDNIGAFFEQIGTISQSASPTEESHTDPIDVKNFIEWCNKPCNPCEILESYYKKPEYRKKCNSGPTYKLANTVRKLNELNEDKLKEMKSALEEGRWTEWCKDSDITALKDDAAFYLVLKCHTDDRHHYHFHFDKDAVAEVDAFDPFTEVNGEEVLDQQWHVLISLLAYLDIAHALRNYQHEYHCLCPHLNKCDKCDKCDKENFAKRHLRLEWKKSRKETPRILQVGTVSRDKKSFEPIKDKGPYFAVPMMDLIENALTGKIASASLH